jgi:predicted MFS family arabinose efflux permease
LPKATGVDGADTARGCNELAVPPVLNIIALATFAASLTTRALDPVLPHVAGDFSISIAAAAGFASVFAFTFAIVQPVLGAAADLFGKARLMVVCLVLLGLANILGALSSSFSLLFATRILAGIGAGGVFPISLSLTSDLVAPNKRQVAIGRTLAGSMTGNLLGASLSGLIGDLLGWRGVLAVLGLLAVVASVAVAIGFRGGGLTRTPTKVDLSVLRHGYRTIFANPNARVCYTAVFIEGCCVLGLFPYVASFLFEQGVTSLSISGLVIAGFAVGGLFYTLSVSRLLPRLGVNVMMISGAVLMGLQLAIIAFGPRWQLQAVNFIFMGWGFYLLHGSLQVFASELSVEARATALSLHSFFFFMGQTVGPIAYGFGILNAGKIPALLTSAIIVVALGFACAGLLRQSRPTDADARPDVQP